MRWATIDEQITHLVVRDSGKETAENPGLVDCAVFGLWLLALVAISFYLCVKFVCFCVWVGRYI